MVKVLVTDNKSKNVSAAIISGLKRQVNELNSSEYNYADIMKSVTLFKEYSRLLSAYFGIEINIKFDIQHSSKVKVDKVNNTVPKVQLNDLNAALRSNYSAIVQIVGQIESIYNKAYEDYKSMIALYDTERLEYNDFRDDAVSEIDSLTEALNNTEIITEEEITEAIADAIAETGSQIEETEQAVDTTAQEVWDTNKGYETSSQIQEDAIKAAEDYVENNAQAHDAAQAAEEANKAQLEADEAQTKADAANALASEAIQSYIEAKSEYDDASKAYDNALAGHGAAYDVQAAEKAGELPAAGETTVIQGTADPNSVVTITNNGDGTITYTVENSNGAYDSRTSTLSDIVSGADIHDAKTEVDDNAKELQNAFENVNTKESEMMNATKAAAEETAAAKEAQTKAEEAQQTADDASIPYATDDELENGWDGSNNTEDDYGDDNWGDWSDLASDFINSDDDDDDTGGDDDE